MAPVTLVEDVEEARRTLRSVLEKLEAISNLSLHALPRYQRDLDVLDTCARGIVRDARRQARVEADSG